MLRDLRIRNVAIIDELSIEFDGGLNLLTGETGAGKSIIIDALGLALGQRGSAELVRSGAREAVVEAVFCHVQTPALRALAEEAGFEIGEELILRRRYAAGGVSRAFVNDFQVNLTTLAQIGAQLVTVHGQGEGDELLSADGQLSLLDQYGGLEERTGELGLLHERLSAARAELESITADERSRARELDLLTHQINEIEAARLDADEETELRKQREIMRNAEQIRRTGEQAYGGLYDNEDSIIGRLAEVEKLIGDLGEFDPRFRAVSANLESSRFQMEDAAAELRDFLAGVDLDPEHLQEIELRLDLYKTLQRKYGPDTPDVFKFLDDARQRHEKLQTAEARMSGLAEEVEELKREYQAKAAELSADRARTAKKFCRDVEKHLAELAMEKAKFGVALEPHPRGATRTGVDRVTFMISANPGEAPKPLSRVASGGEQSRLMLAIKSSTFKPERHRSVIFDEVDTGIGGRVADFVGRKLARLARGQQVICITHLPQIAAYAAHHATVNKRSAGGETLVGVETLDGEGQVTEIARMLGGETITEISREHARQLLAQAEAHATD